MSIERNESRVITEELLAAMKPVLEKHGLVINKSHTTYGGIYALKVEASIPVLNARGEDEGTPEAITYLRYCKLDGHRDDAIGDVFMGKYVFLGENAKSPKYRWKVREVRTGKLLKLSSTPAFDAWLAAKPSA